MELRIRRQVTLRRSPFEAPSKPLPQKPLRRGMRLPRMPLYLILILILILIREGKGLPPLGGKTPHS